MKERIVKFALKTYLTHPKLADRLVRLAMSELFNADSPGEVKKYIIVYRIQNSTGLGAFRNPLAWKSLQDYNRFISLDINKTNYGYKQLPDPLIDPGFSSLERQSISGRLFAFESPEQANTYIMPQQWTLLKANGFDLQPIKARKAWKSESQVYFEPYK